MSTLLVNPRIGILFLVPGMNETLRINGTEEAFLHCAKALVRSDLWNAEKHIDRAVLPSYPAMLLDHVGGLTHEENERQTQVMAERGLY
jgi:hypothetical protein